MIYLIAAYNVVLFGATNAFLLPAATPGLLFVHAIAWASGILLLGALAKWRTL